MKAFKVSCLMSIVLLSAATASALPQKINLREREKLIAELTAKENDEKAKPLQRAWAGFDRRQLEMFLCEDKDLAAKEKAFEDFIANPGLGEDDRVRFLFDLAGKDDFKFRRVELYKTAEKLAMASTNASVHAIFYELSNRVMTPSHWSWCTDLLPEFSADARLRLVEQAQADPVVKGHIERGWLPVKRWRVEALQQLGRFDEVEKILRESVEQATEKNAKSGAAAALAKFYEERATRWYDEPNADLLKKALGIWELAAALGMKTVIVDDGWQTDDTSRGYPYCGDWRPAAAKFPDMRAHVARVHALGMKYLLWYGVPLVGVKSEAYGRFRGKFLYENAGMRAAALDPRFPEVRAHLSDVFARALRDWDLDGFKFDFIDAFRFDGPDPAVAEDYAGRDVKSLPEATDRLMTEVTRRLGTIKPGLLIEFRQSYVGPVVRKFGNIIRAGDCPGDFVLNRRRIADLRLTSGATAVHADMLEWHPSDTPEKAARYVLAALFSTIQYSMILGKLPPEHERMMRHYLAFTSEHRATLQEGAFRPHGLAEGYPWIGAEGADERIAAVYDADTCVRVPADGRTTYVMNATSIGRVLVDLAVAPKSVRAYDVFGTPVAAPDAHAGVQSLACPEAGYLQFEFNK